MMDDKNMGQEDQTYNPRLKDAGPKIRVQNPFSTSSPLGPTHQQDISSFVSEVNHLLKSVKATSSEMAGPEWLSITNSQKQFVIDVFAWKKDEFADEVFLNLLNNIKYSLIDNPTAALVFFNSFEFHLFLKKRYSFYPFDQEEQNYPEGDNFFLSKDSSFVFEYQENEKSTEVMEEMLEIILQAVGSEKFISKLQLSSADSYLWLEEEAYSFRNSRLMERGYPTYEEALEWQTPKASLSAKTSKKLVTNTKNETLPEKISAHGQLEKSPQVQLGILKTLQAVFEYKKSHETFDFTMGEKLLKESLSDVLYFTTLGKSLAAKMNQEVELDFKELYRMGITYLKELKKNVAKFREYHLTLNLEWSWFGDLVTGLIDDTETIVISVNNEQSPFNLRSLTGIDNFLRLLEFMKTNKRLLTDYHDMLDQFAKAQKWSSINYRPEEISIEQMLISDFVNYVVSQTFMSEQKIGVTWENLLVFQKDWMTLQDIEKSNFLRQFGQQRGVHENDLAILENYLHQLLKTDIVNMNLNEINQEDVKFVSGVILVQHWH